MRGILAGALALIALQAVTSSDKAAGRVGGMLGGLAGLVRRALDPSVPLIPDLAGTTGAETSSSSTSWSTVPVEARRRRRRNDDDDDQDDGTNPIPRRPAVVST